MCVELRLVQQPVSARQPQIVAVEHVPAWALALTHLVNFEDLAGRRRHQNETSALSLTSHCFE